MGGLTHGPVQALDRTAPWRECVDEAQWLHIVAGQTSRCGPQDPLPGGPIPQPIQARPRPRGPTIAVIAVEVCLGQRPIRRGRHIRAKPGQVLGHRLRLTGGRAPDIPGDFPGTPPAGVMAQDPCLCRRPAPMAEGTSRQSPTVVPRRSVPSPCGVSANTIRLKFCWQVESENATGRYGLSPPLPWPSH